MPLNLDDSIAMLARTPTVLDALLRGLPETWTHATEGPDTWSPFDILGHLIHGEETDWIPRATIIRTHGPARPFDPFDRLAMFEASKGKSMDDLLDTFAALRAGNLATLKRWDLQPVDFSLPGTHPELGSTTLGQLLATWVVHDLGHVRQIARVMAKRYTLAVGPWQAYLRVLHE